MKSNGKRKGRRKRKQRMRAWGEIIYNCPYLIAVLTTSLIVVIFSDEIGIRAIAREAQSTMWQTMDFGTLKENLPENVEEEYVITDVNDVENLDKYDIDTMENAGKRKEEINDMQDDKEHKNDIGDEENLENTEEAVKGVTRFEFYEPQETDSYYYSDAGKVALTTDYPYTKENISYFNDAIFIGDSRTLGISDYAGLEEADFYCDSGMTILKLLDAGGVTYQKTGKKEDLNQVLQQKQYGKVYIMLGMNDLGYGNTDMYLERYRHIVDQIREWQPHAIIYVMANLHVSREKNNLDTEFNNININDKNAASALLANGTDIFYLDANPLFTDSEGFLNAELSFDGVHLYAQHYDAWREFLLEHAVEPMDAEPVEAEETDVEATDGRDPIE
ncbi:MAG: hypothetical protein J1F18_03915 [Lachnospiraceae bacterium]|nr:hypothetical protein [Lachnospiraceae bacterium]